MIVNPFNDLDALAYAMVNNIGNLFDYLNLSFTWTGKMFVGACPIHNGDNTRAFNLYIDQGRARWVCRTHQCEKIFKGTIIGFTRGVLSNKKLDWIGPADSKFSFWDTVKILKELVGKPLQEIKIPEYKKIERSRNNFRMDRERVRSLLRIPAEYYVKRGYNAKNLDELDVGLCDKPKKEMSNRVVVPVYDDKQQFMIGCIGRSIHDKCSKCSLYHPLSWNICPSYYQQYFVKWRNQRNFYTGSYLYNYWNAKEYIRKTHTAIIAEGAGDIFRLKEAGFHNCVGTFGINLTDEQEIILETSGAVNLIICYDNDKAGEIGIKNIKRRFSRMYELNFPKLIRKDIGDMSINEVKELLCAVKF